MKQPLLILLSVILLASVSAGFAADGGTSVTAKDAQGIDRGCLPASADQIQKELSSAGDDPLALYSAIYHAGRNGLELAAWADLRSLKEEHPDNPYILSACCFAYGVACGHYGLNRYHSAFGMNIDENQEMIYDADLAKAERLDPKLWLIYLLKAEPAIMPGNGDRKQALIDLQTAVRLGPLIPYTHFTLAYFLSTPNATPQEQQESIWQAKAATRLKPVDAQAAFLLFEIYAIDLHDHVNGLAYKQLLLSEIPATYKLADETKQLLANFPK